jgi:spore germination protein GerM
MLLFAACGIDESSAPTVLEDENLPCVLRGDCDTSATSPPSGSTTHTIVVYFVERIGDDTRLKETERDVAGSDVLAALEALFTAPPDDDERERGLTTSIPEQATLRDVTDVGNGVVRVNLSEGFGNVTGQGQRVAYAQIVWTATELEGVSGVLFAIEGEPQSAITGAGTPKDDPVRRSDYADFRPL